MARLLVDAVEGSDPVPRRVILATELIRRASSAGRRIALSRPATGGRRRTEARMPQPLRPRSRGGRSSQISHRRRSISDEPVLDPARAALIALAGVVAILAAACGGATTSPSASAAAASQRTAAAAAARRRPDPPPLVTPAPIAAGPGPNGGTVVRWFIGLGAGGQPAADRGRADVRRQASTTSREGQVYISLEIYDNKVAANILKIADRRRQPAGHHRPGRRRRPQHLPRPAARPEAADRRRPNYDMTKFDPALVDFFKHRQGRRHDRRAVRDLPVVHLLQQEAVRRGQAAVPADQGRRPVRGQAVGHGRRSRAGHEAHRRQERQRRHERRLRPRRTSSSGASTCSGRTTAPTPRPPSSAPARSSPRTARPPRSRDQFTQPA